jgi:thioredoxin-related protein
MVLGEILETIITSITSITVALIAAGFFKRFSDRNKENNSKKKLVKQIEKDELIHFTLREMRRKYHTDRIFIIQFHNGGVFYTSSPMQKASVTYERASDGLERISDTLQNVFVSHYTWFIKQTMAGELFYVDCENVEDVATKALFRKYGVQANAAVPIYDIQDHLISILVLDWVFSEIPSDFIKDGKFTSEFKDELTADSESVGNLIN